MAEPTQNGASVAQEPTFPQESLRIVPQGLIITVQFTPTFSINQLIPANAMNEIAGAWLESRKQIKKDLEIIRDVNRSKLS